MNLPWLRRARRADFPAPDNAASFFFDAVEAPAEPEPADSVQRVSRLLLAAIALATLAGMAGLFGLPQFLRT